MHSVEVVLDERADAAVREQWHDLTAAGVPSQGRHANESNRPHVTLAVADTISSSAHDRLARLAATLPVPLVLGGLVLFGRRRFVLARLVVPSLPLLEFQAAVVAALDDPIDPHRNFGPGRWTAHVTLARRLTSQQVGTALDALHHLSDVPGAAARARRWDIEAKREQWLAEPGATDGAPTQ